MPNLNNPPALTPHHVIRRLEAGHKVSLDEPGWMDTQRSTCPDCGRLTMQFKGHQHVRFEYGIGQAHPHRCGQEVTAEEHPKWLRLEAVNAELDSLNRRYELEHIQHVWGPKP